MDLSIRLKRTPEFSRAVDMDEDDENEESEQERILNSSFVRLTPEIRREIAKSPTSTPSALSSYALIIGEGFTACGFLEAYVLADDRELIGAMFSGSGPQSVVNTASQTSPTDRSCFLYRLRSNPDIIVCLCKVELTSAQLHSWVSSLMSIIDLPNTRVAMLTTTSLSAYRSEFPTSALEPPMMRSLKTKRVAAKPPCPYLEQPNMAEGLLASVLTHCQVHGLQAIGYILFVENVSRIDTNDMRAFKPLLQYTPFRDCFEARGTSYVDPEEVLSRIGRQFRENLSIYT